jgi:hypothetical protein
VVALLYVHAKIRYKDVKFVPYDSTLLFVLFKNLYLFCLENSMLEYYVICIFSFLKTLRKKLK